MTATLFRPGIFLHGFGRCILLIMWLLGSGRAFAQQPSLDTQPVAVTSICAGSSIDVTGVRSFVGGDFRVELSDGGGTYAEIPSSFLSASGRYEVTYRATIPVNTPAGSNYRIRLISKNPAVSGVPSPTQLTIRPVATATLTGNQSIYEGQSGQLSVAFTGDGPWNFTYQDSTDVGLGAVMSIVANASPHIIAIKPLKTTSYLLTGVSNLCGSGVVLNRTVRVNVSPLLGIDNQLLDDSVVIYPVPATMTLTVRTNELAATESALLELIDMTGRKLLKQETRQSTSSLTLDSYPAGTYILNIRIGDRSISKRIVKF